MYERKMFYGIEHRMIFVVRQIDKSQILLRTKIIDVHAYLGGDQSIIIFHIMIWCTS